MSSGTPTAADRTKELIRYRVDAGVAILELSDPPANTYSYEMNRQFDDAILRARMDNDVYVIVLTGAGEKFFSAGANIQMLTEVDPTFKYYFCLHANETLLRLEHTPKLCSAPSRPKERRPPWWCRQAGAFDFVLKPNGTTIDANIDQLRRELQTKIAAFARAAECPGTPCTARATAAVRVPKLRSR